MKRRVLIAHLTRHGCRLVREGGAHSWWRNADGRRRTAVPRHREVGSNLAKEICEQLGVPPPIGGK